MKDIKDFDDVRWDDGKPTVTDYVWGRDNQTASLIRAYKDEIDQLREALTIALSALVAATSLLKRSEDEKVKPSRAVASNKIFRLMMADYERAEDNARAALLGEKE